MLFLLAVLMQQITTEQLQTELGRSPRDKAIVDDAVARWARKNGLSGGHPRAMEERVVIVAHMGQERCVLLKLRARSVGGSPVYCYAQNSTKLVRSFDDVE